MIDPHKAAARAVVFGLLIALVACSGPGDTSEPISSDEAVRTLDALVTDAETALTGVENDPDLAVVAGFFGGTATVTPAGVLSPAQLAEPFELPRGVMVWSTDTGYAPDEGATPPAPYDYQAIGNPSDADAELLIDWDAGDPTTTLAFAGSTIELPTDASAVAVVGGETVVEATLTASWELVEETRCSATASSLTATSLVFEVTAGSRTFTATVATTPDSTSLSLELALGGFGADLGFTIDEQLRILAEPCQAGLPLGGAIGTPSSAGLDLSVTSPDHSAAVSAAFADIVWNTAVEPVMLAAFDVSGSLTIDGSEAGTLAGSFDEAASPPFDGSVTFDDKTMTFDEIVDELSGTQP